MPLNPSELLLRVADTDNTSDRRDALVTLIGTRLLPSVVDSEPFRRGLERFADSVRESTSESERLLAVASLERAASARSLKDVARESIRALLKDAITRPLSSVHPLADKDDRLYAVRALRDMHSAWPPDALAATAAREESGEKVRAECIAGLVARTEDEDDVGPVSRVGSGPHDIAGVVSALRKALEKVEFTTKKPGDSMGHRVTRILNALNAALAGADKRVGQDAGREIGLLVVRAFRVAGRPETPRVRKEVAEQVAALIHATIRMDFSQGGRGATYRALSFVSRWFTAGEWRDICESSPAVRRVRKDVRTSLVLLMEAGKTDDRLREMLAEFVGSRDAASATYRAIATERPGIPDDIRDWLVRARKRIPVASAVESRERAVDEVLAELLIAMQRLTRAAETVRADVLPDVSIVLPRQATPLSRLTGLAEEMAGKLGLAAEWRSLRLRGEAGQEVDFSPTDHDRDPDDPHTRRVRLLRPVVVRDSEDRVPRVVLRAPVEPIANDWEREDRDVPAVTAART